MAAIDLRELFPVLENQDGSGAGLTKVNTGQAITTVSGAAPVMAFQDSNGNFVWPQLDTQGRIKVSENATGVLLRARGQLDTGNATSGYVTVTGATLTLVAGATYVLASLVVSCFRETAAQLIWNNNGSQTILEDVLLGPGQYTCQIGLPNDSIVAGSGTQQLFVQARNTTSNPSAIRASLVATQTQ